MKPKKNSATIKAGHELVIDRTLDSPRALVFSAWTDPAHLAAWWGPEGFTATIVKWDAVAGGAIRIDMHGPDGTTYPMTGTFVDVVAPERIVFASSALDASGRALFDIQTTVTLFEQGKRTKLTLVARVTRTTKEAGPYLAGLEAGWTQSLGRLSNCVSGLRRT